MAKNRRTPRPFKYRNRWRGQVTLSNGTRPHADFNTMQEAKDWIADTLTQDTEHEPALGGPTQATLAQASLPFPTDIRESLSETLDSVRDMAGDLARVLKIGALHTLPDSVPSFVEGKEVTDVVAALVASDVEELNDEAFASLVQGPLPTDRASLH